MKMRLGPLLKGAATFVPGFGAIAANVGAGSTNSAEYCYGVWLRHLSFLASHGVATVPRSVAEIGPGGSLGIGICALLSGSESYIALDAVKYSSAAANLLVLDQLVAMFQARAARPSIMQWPNYDQCLDSRLFPSGILSESVLKNSLAPDRLARIHRLVQGEKLVDGGITLDYRAPWSDANVIPAASVDFLISHAVLEHVDDIDDIYSKMAYWLKPGGVMSHQIDFDSHHLSNDWNGHWAYSDFIWKIIRGRRPYLINRLPSSYHENAIAAKGLHTLITLKKTREDGIGRAELATRFIKLSDADLHCQSLFIQARRPT